MQKIKSLYYFNISVSYKDQMKDELIVIGSYCNKNDEKFTYAFRVAGIGTRARYDMLQKGCFF